MGTRERRQREKEELRKKILDAARGLFVEVGYEAVTMRMIAARIDYSPTAIYFHFKDKRALLRELCETDFLALAGAFGRIARVVDPVERLKKIGLAYVKFAQEYPHQYRLMFMTPLPPQDPDLSRIHRGNPEEDAYAFLLATVAEGVKAGRFRPEYRDPDLVAQMAWASMHGIISLHLAKGKDAWVKWRPLPRTAASLIDGLFVGLLEPAAGASIHKETGAAALRGRHG